MPDPVESRVRQLVADLFDLTPDRIDVSTSPETVVGWDSVQHLNIVLGLEQTLGIQIDPEEIESMKSVGSIVEMVRRKLHPPG